MKGKISKKSLLSKFEWAFTIKFKLLLSFLISIILIIILGVASFHKAASAIKSSYKESTSKTLNMTGEYLDFGFDSIEDTAAQLTNDTYVLNYFSGMYGDDNFQLNNVRQSIEKELTSKTLTDDFIDNIYLISDKMETISTKKIDSTGLYLGFLDTEYGKLLQQNSMAIIWSGSNGYLDERLGTGDLDYTLRYIRNISSVNGIIVIDISYKTISSILENIDFDEKGLLSMVTSDGKELTADGISDEVIFYDKDFYKEAQESTEISGSKYVNYKGGKYLFMYTKLEKSNAMICTLVSEATISKQAAGIGLFTLITVMIACVIAVLTALIIIRGINSSIKDITSGLKIASVGDLTVEFTSKRNDEFRVLIKEIQSTFSNMKTLIFGVKNLSSEVLDSSSRVEEATMDFKKATEEISIAMNEVEQGIVQQAKDAEGCLIEMDNLSQRIISVSDSTREITRITEQTKESIKEGTDCTERLNDQTKSTIEITTNIIKKVEQQANNSLTIGKISNVISDIANQINLLSLNASIESARAGEFGRGFAVIANEIRNLAEQSKNSVEEIKKIISNIQEETERTMEIAQEAEHVLLLQENAVKETTDSYLSINQNVEQLVVNLQYITTAIEDIEESRVSTLGAIESISAVLEEIAASTNTVSQASKNQILSVDSVSKSSVALTDNANQLLQEVEKFTV